MPRHSAAAMYPVCSEVAPASTGRQLRAPTSSSPEPSDATSCNAAAAPHSATLDSAKLLQTLLLVQQEFHAEQSQLQLQLSQLTQHNATKDAQLAKLQAALDEATEACSSKEECMREMERERAEWLDVLMCVKQMHGEMVDKMAAMKQRKIKRLVDVAKGRARVV